MPVDTAPDLRFGVAKEELTGLAGLALAAGATGPLHSFVRQCVEDRTAGSGQPLRPVGVTAWSFGRVHGFDALRPATLPDSVASPARPARGCGTLECVPHAAPCPH